jgi:hypothetical protein
LSVDWTRSSALVRCEQQSLGNFLCFELLLFRSLHTRSRDESTFRNLGQIQAAIPHVATTTRSRMNRARNLNRRSAFAAGFLLFYELLLGLAAAKHTFWRDETQAWLIARDSPTILSLLHNLRYEGHPPLWHLLLFPLTRLSWNPEWMELPNLLCAGVAAALVLFSLRMSIAVRVGIAFSYYLLFEYGVITRNYMIGVALLLAATVLATRRETSTPWAIPILLGLAALSSLPALILSLCLFGLNLAQNAGLIDIGGNPHPPRTAKASTLLASSFFSLCALGSVLSIRPPSDTGVFLEIPAFFSSGLREKLVRCGTDLVGAYLPVPEVTSQFWNSSFFHFLSPALVALLGWGLLVAFALYLKRPAARYFFLIGSVLLLLQLIVSWRAWMRNVGWLFICLVLALLLEHAKLGSIDTDAERSTWRTWLLAVILVSQVGSGLFALAISLKYPFSNSRNVVDLLRSQHLDASPLVFERDYIGSSILAYMHRPNFYNLEQHRPASFVVWNRDEVLQRHTPTRAEMKLLSDSNGPPVLITDKPLKPEDERHLGVHRLSVYDNAICSMEIYYVYH